jgi:hypothetical protein
MPQEPLSIGSLFSGGVIVTYRCTSRCRHCLYASSPRRENRYISRETAAAAFRIIRRMGCDSVHIGGGEPFLDTEGLFGLLEAARDSGVGIEYIETNSSWFHDEASAAAMLKSLSALGARTLLVSISPFHNEYVPFNRVRGVIAACRRAGVSVFPWVDGFIEDLSRMDGDSIHALEEYLERFGPDYVQNLPSRYWISWGGRAVSTFQGLFPAVPLDELGAARRGCSELSDTSHFHIDLDGNYVPGLCSGLAIDMKDLASPLDAARYPLITILHNDGPAALAEHARKTQGFNPKGEYMNKCHLCLDVRRFLVTEGGLRTPELAPGEFYGNL